MSWTDERIKKLKSLWADGLSASQVAAELGGVSRNAVISKLHRHGIAKRTTGWGSRPGSTAPRPHRKPTGLTVRRSDLFERLSRRDHRARMLPREPIPEVDDSAIPRGQRRTLHELTGSTCRWPVGDPQLPGFFFCGAAPASCSPYCAAHVARAGNGFGREFRNVDRWAA
jgi:GcrA cell cycle regulator